MSSDNKSPLSYPYPSDWPDEEFHTRPNCASVEIMEQMICLINRNASETEIDQFLTRNKSLLAVFLSLFSTGHHHTWVIPKKIIKTKAYTSDKGLIPDFLVGGSDSDGKNWYAIELKSPNDKLFTTSSNKIYFSAQMNKGMNQLMDYIQILDRDQAHLRDAHKLIDLSNPKGVLVIGREEEMQENEVKQRLKKGWNNSNKRLEIRTFDSFKRVLEERIELIQNPPALGWTPWD